MSEHHNPGPQKPPKRPRKPKRLGDCDSLPPGGYLVEKGDCFVRDQFVVIGVSSDIDTIIQELSTRYPDLRQWQIQQIDLDFLGDLVSTGSPGGPNADSDAEPPILPGFRDDQLKDLVIRVYRLPEEGGTRGLISAFNGQARTRSVPVYAEPNYLTGGSSGCIEGGPAMPGVGGGVEQEFWDQWALRGDGIDLPAVEVQAKKKDVRVAVFDTSPFLYPGEWRIKWINPYLDLCVSHPEPLVDAIPKEPEFDFDYSDHGLFVSSLIHAVARDSRIHLIRVLNEYNLGDLGTLVKALCEFLLRDSHKREGTLRGTVINLSLGLKDEPGSDRSFLCTVRDDIAALDDILRLVNTSSPDEIPAVYLRIVLDLAHRAGAIIVACAGNKLVGGPIGEAETPACYPFVIGVAGHNKDQRRSSFSKAGDIAAPAGEGLPHHNPLNDDKTIRDPDDWLIGLSMHLGQPEGYMYWMGTSFAAPLVAGQAARLLVAGAQPSGVRGRVEGAAIPSADTALGKGRSKVPHP